MIDQILISGRSAVVTGAASGIGLETARRLATLGMKVCLADCDGAALDRAAAQLAAAAPGGDAAILAVETDVADVDSVASLCEAVTTQFGPVAFLMNNAVVRDTGRPWEAREAWRQAMEVNFWGVYNVVQAFLPFMLAAEAPGIIVNTGSKQGITNPPKNPPYNVTKAALKAYTELLQHELRNTPGAQVTAHLLVPGSTTTGTREHREGAWWPAQVVDFMLDALARGNFYILCPDGETTPEMDRLRMLWAAGDMIENRPSLSRWHPDHAAAFASFKG